MRLGVCYYPEHWPPEQWHDDARRMAALGLTRVRIAEFAWSRIEPLPGQFDWTWLDRAVETLADAGLGVILCTPTATPPKWLVDRMPDMLQVGEDGRTRRFGSRRHYCFSHTGYRHEAARITQAVAERYGEHPAVTAWQTDNEYGCHDTVVSYSSAAAAGFREWLRSRYPDVPALNDAWGTVFWSQEYRAFEDIDPPFQTVTEPNPAHVLDYRRFASDEVVAFNRLQVDILRRLSPGRDIMHNAMGFFPAFDHHDLGRDLDVMGWDSYPLGFLEQFFFSDIEKVRYARNGHPDIAAFHHDLYRGCTPDRRWAVLEQQPGPVNWARHNPAPAPGMVRLWTLEALAHGAELVSYFRWRQSPFGQEAMHAGLLRPDSVDGPAVAEVRQSAADIVSLGPLETGRAPVALVFDYPSIWSWEAQPQGRDFSGLELAFAMYSALRRLGLDIDIVSADASLDDYAMVVVPSLASVTRALADRFASLAARVLFGPRTGSKTADFKIPPELAPGHLQTLLPLKVVRVESLRPGLTVAGDGFTIRRWIEDIEAAILPEIETADGRGVVFASGSARYLAAWPDEALLARIFAAMASEAGVPITHLPPDLRLRSAGGLRFAFNYGPDAIDLQTWLGECDVILGGTTVLPSGVTVLRT